MPVFLFHHVIRGGFHIQLHEHGVHDDLLMPTRFSRESTAGDAVSPSLPRSAPTPEEIRHREHKPREI
jgi:hypothetical protein